MTDDLLAELVAAEQSRLHLTGKSPCQACYAVQFEDSPERQDALRRALGGTIGRDTLLGILHRQGIKVGRRHLEKHRQEGHTP